jgi:hypothetical protein
VEVTPEQLNELRFILMVGWFAACLLLLLVNWDELRTPKKPKAEFCKLHSRPITECTSQHTPGDS